MALTDKSSIVVPKGFYGKTSVLQGYNPQTESLVDLDVTRNTTATRINEQGLIENVAANVPRRDFLNGGCGELLVEPQRTNKLEYSEDFTNAVWVDKIGGTGVAPVITANDEISPDGTLNADKIFFDSGGGNTASDESQIQQSAVFGNEIEHAGAVWLKGDAGGEQIGIGAWDGGYTLFTLTKKWERYTITGTSSGTVRTFQLGIRQGVVGTINSSATVYAWGAQVEEGEYPSSYIPTTTSTLTRNKDLTSIDLSTEGVNEKYAVLFNVESDGGRLLMSSAGAGFDLDIKNSGRFAMLVDLNTITFKFPDNGQPQTELVYEKPADFRDIDFEAKLGPVRLDEVIWTEELQPSEYNAWLSGTVSSSFLETDWSVQTDFEDEFREEDWDYFPVIDVSSGTDFRSAWNNNQLTSFPQLDVSSGTDFRAAWSDNQLTSFPQLDVSLGTDFRAAWDDNQLTSFPLLDVSSGANFFTAWRRNQLTSFPLLDVSSGTDFRFAWDGNQLTSFPQLDVSSGTDFRAAWRNNQLTSFPANMFDSLASPNNNCFVSAWTGSNVIDAQGMENILVSIDTSGASAPASGVDIGISSNGDTLTAATNTAITSLKGKGWTITIDGVAQ